MDILKKLPLLLCAPLLTACYTDFEPKIDSAPVLCMNAVIDAGEEFTVQLSHSWRYDDYEAYKADHTVTDGTVDVYADGNPVCRATYSEWTETDAYGAERKRSGYLIPYKPQAGQEVSLRACSPKYGTADAVVTIPFEPLTGTAQVDKTVEVNNYLFEDDPYGGSYAYQYFHISMNIKLPVNDRSGINEYFQLAWEAADCSNEDVDFNCGNPEFDMEPIFSEHIDALETVFASDAWGFTVFSDNSFRGSSYPLHLMFRNISLHRVSAEPDDSLPDGCYMRLILFSLDRNLYNWYMYDWHESESFVGMLGRIGLAENTTSYSNVSTRAGLVVARNRSVIEISL